MKPLTADQATLVELILKGHTQASAAREMSKDQAQISRWMRVPAVASALSDKRSDRRRAASEGIDAGVLESVVMFREIVRNKKAPFIARIAAGRELMRLADMYPTKLNRSSATSLLGADQPTDAQAAEVFKALGLAPAPAATRRRGEG